MPLSLVRNRNDSYILRSSEIPMVESSEHVERNWADLSAVFMWQPFFNRVIAKGLVMTNVRRRFFVKEMTSFCCGEAFLSGIVTSY